MATGTDAACRLSRAGSPGVSPFIVGWDPTPMYGFLAATLVAGRLMGLTREQMVAAVGLAYHQMSGNAQASIDGTHAKRMGAGLCRVWRRDVGTPGQAGRVRIVPMCWRASRACSSNIMAANMSKEALLGGLG